MNLELLPLSFAAGIATFFSPCFGAMLPAYISTYLSKQETNRRSFWWRGKQGLYLGLIVSAGFLTSLAILGALFGAIGSIVARYLPWVAVAIAFFIIVAGAIILIKPAFTFSLSHLISKWYRPKTDQGLISFYGYGIIYSVCAAACTLPIFLAIMTQTFVNGGMFGGMLNFLAYGFGMSFMMILLSLSLAFSKTVAVRIFPKAVQKMQRISGFLMILAGGYVLYYLLFYGRYLDDLLEQLKGTTWFEMRFHWVDLEALKLALIGLGS